MKRIAKFHKVSFEQFKEGWIDTFGEVGESEIQNIYDAVKLPKRATSGSAGYDFYTPNSTGRDSEDSDWNPCGDGRKLGFKMLSEKWAWF